MTKNLPPMPDAQGFFGPYGGQLVPPELKKCMDEIATAYEEIVKRKDFQDELASLLPTMWVAPAPYFTPSACPINWAVRRFTSSVKT